MKIIDYEHIGDYSIVRVLKESLLLIKTCGLDNNDTVNIDDLVKYDINCCFLRWTDEKFVSSVCYNQERVNFPYELTYPIEVESSLLTNGWLRDYFF